MTAKYKTSGRMRQTMIARYKEANPGISDQEAYDLWRADMRARGSKGGKAPVGGFSLIPGLAQKAGRISAKNRNK